MSKEVYDKLVLAAKNNKSICINIIELTDIIKDAHVTDVVNFPHDFQPIAGMEILETGLCGKVAGANCYVAPFIAPGAMRTSNLENPPASMKDLQFKSSLLEPEDNIRQYWSAEFPIVEYKKQHE